MIGRSFANTTPVAYRSLILLRLQPYGSNKNISAAALRGNFAYGGAFPLSKRSMDYLVLAVWDRGSDTKVISDAVELRRRCHRQVRQRGQRVSSGFGRHVRRGRREVRDGLDRTSGVGESKPGAQHLVEGERLSGTRHNNLENGSFPHHLCSGKIGFVRVLQAGLILATKKSRSLPLAADKLQCCLRWIFSPS